MDVFILIQISLKFFPKGLIDNKPVFVQVMACGLFGAKKSSQPMLTSSLTHICDIKLDEWRDVILHVSALATNHTQTFGLKFAKQV